MEERETAWFVSNPRNTKDLQWQQKLGRSKWGCSPAGSEGMLPWWHLGVIFLSCKTVRRYISVALSYQVCGCSLLLRYCNGVLRFMGSQRVGHDWLNWTELNCSGTPLQNSCLENLMGGGAWWAAIHGVAKSRTWLSDFTFTFHFHALEKEMETHSSVLAWRIPGMGEPGGLPSMGSHRVGHTWSDLAAAAQLKEMSPGKKTYLLFYLYIIWLPDFLWTIRKNPDLWFLL